MVITERQEEILSWLVGMSPIGELFHYERRHACADLNISNPSVFNHDLNRLVDVGAVALESRGLHGIPSQMRVFKRPEDFTVVAIPKRVVRYAGYEARAAA
jgi:hypothetical protein